MLDRGEQLLWMTGTEENKRPTNTRRSPRYEIDTELDATTSGAGNRGPVRGRSLNISEVGMGGLFVTGWDLGTAVNLQFSVPVASTPVRLEAVVRSRSDYRYGFEFAELNPDQRELISKTCRTLALLE
jgi:c-di-GMP-binding flagellar brake protein YcgR